jgi:hypothetical protein
MQDPDAIFFHKVCVPSATRYASEQNIKDAIAVKDDLRIFCFSKVPLLIELSLTLCNTAIYLRALGFRT